MTTPTRRPAASSTSTAARPLSEANASVNESAHSTTSYGRRRATRRTTSAGPAAQRLGGERRARERRWSMPAAALASRCTAPTRITRLASGATGCGEPGPARQPAQRVVAARPEPAAVALVQRLGLVGRHVDAGRAVRRAALAGQAQVERLVHLVGPPAAGDQRAVDHLLEHPGAAAGGVLLVPGGEVGRAHHAAGAGVVGDALADAGAAVHGVDDRAAVVGQPQGRAAARAAGPPAAGRRRPAAGRPARRG